MHPFRGSSACFLASCSNTYSLIRNWGKLSSVGTRKAIKFWLRLYVVTRYILPLLLFYPVFKKIDTTGCEDSNYWLQTQNIQRLIIYTVNTVANTATDKRGNKTQIWLYNNIKCNINTVLQFIMQIKSQLGNAISKILRFLFQWHNSDYQKIQAWIHNVIQAIYSQY